MLEAGARGGKWQDRFECLAGRIRQAEAETFTERVGRADPAMFERFQAVERSDLSVRRYGDKKARVETFRQSRRRQPMAVVRQPIHREAQAEPRADGSEVGVTAPDRRAHLDQLLRR